jgi:hypothetical protein
MFDIYYHNIIKHILGQSTKKKENKENSKKQTNLKCLSPQKNKILYIIAMLTTVSISRHAFNFVSKSQ